MRLPRPVPRRSQRRPINQTRPLDPRGHIEIDNLKGRIQVRAWDRNEVHITGSLGDGVEKLVVEGDGDHLVVRAEYPKHIGGWRGDRTGPTDLLLQVPLRADLDIESVSADIDVDGVAPGDLSIDTVSGDVVAAAAPRNADINSVSGDLQRHAQQQRRQGRDRQRRRAPARPAQRRGARRDRVRAIVDRQPAKPCAG